MPAYDFRTMEEQIDAQLQIERMIAVLAACFGVLAMILAAVGLYGVISYVVATRTREIGVRLALGARRRWVFAMVMKDIGALLAAGLGLGVIAGLASTRYVASDLYGVRPADPFVLLAAVVICAAVGALAGFIPAGRATRIDPVRALRWE